MSADHPRRHAQRLKTKEDIRSIDRRSSGALRRAIFVGVLLFIAIHCAAASQVVEIYEHYGTYTLNAPPFNMQPIVLNVPNKFRYQDRGERRGWGINILTYYPSFLSIEDHDNAKFGLNCAGICNGRILISVENRAHSINVSGSPNMADFIARATIKWQMTPPYPPNVHLRSIGASYGFDEAFERSTYELSTNKIVKVERFYFRKSADKSHYDLAATCTQPDTQNFVGRNTCILHFSLRCAPRIYVSVNGLDGSYLAMSSQIQEKADKFVSAMVISPACDR